MKRNSILKTSFKVLALGIALFIGISTVSAWGPTTPVFPHGSGINRVSYPSGLNFPSFNNYTDNVDTSTGANLDERFFLRSKNSTQGGTVYSDSITASPNDVIWVTAFVHNNGYLNDPTVTATGVSSYMPGFTLDNGKYVSASGTSIDLSEYISASNATPSSVWDETYITSATGENIYLEYYDSLSIAPMAGGTYTNLNVSGFFGSGASIGDPSNPTGGSFKGCMDNAMYIYIRFIVRSDVQADVSISSTVDNNTPNVGDTVQYTLTYLNNSTEVANNVNISDTWASSDTGTINNIAITSGAGCTASVGGVACSLGNLASGATGTITYTAQGATIGSVDTTTVISADNDGDPSNNQSATSINIASAGVAPTCTISNSGAINAGETATLTWDVAGAPTSGDISPVISGTPDFTINGSGATNALSADTAYTMTVSNAFGSNTCNTTVVVNPAFSCSSLTASQNPVSANTAFDLNWASQGQISYSITANAVDSANGNDGAQTYNEASGISVNTDYIVTIYSGANQTGNIAQCPALTVAVAIPAVVGIAKGVSTDGINYSNSIQVNDAEIAYYQATISETAGQSASFQVLDTLSAGTAGGTLTQQTAPVITPASACTTGDLLDSLNPLNCTLPALGTLTITYAYLASDSGIVPGTASTFNNLSEILGGDSASVSVIVNGVPANRDLYARISVDDTTKEPSTTATYRIAWNNLGNVDMTNTQVSVSCDPSAVENILTAGGTATGTNIVYGPFDNSPLSSGNFIFTADIQAGFGDPVADNYPCSVHIESLDFGIATESNQTNNDATVTTFVDPAFADSRSKRVKNLTAGQTTWTTTTEAMEGDTLQYQLNYTAGDTDVLGFVFNDDVSDILVYSSITSYGGATLTAGIVEWAPVDILAFQTASVTFEITIFADVEGIGGDYELTNTYGNDVTVITLPNLLRSKTVQINAGAEVISGQANPGDTLTYTLYVQNSGVVNQDGFVFQDDVSDVLEYSTITQANGGVYDASTGVISWAPMTIPAGTTASKSFQVQIDNPLIAGGDYTLRNAYGNSITVITIPDVLIAKSVTNLTTGDSGQSVPANAGDSLTYTLTATEAGGASDFNNFVFTDDVSDVLEYSTISSISDAGVYDGTTETITWAPANITLGTTISRTFTILVNAEASWPAGSNMIMTNVYGDTVNVNLGNILVDNAVQGTASPATISAGQNTVYSISYFNQGDNEATNSYIINDFDETSLVLDTTTLPANCSYIDLANPLYTIGGSMGIYCTLGTLTAHSATQTISFTAQGAVGLGATNIVNTAIIGQDQIDNNPSNNQSSSNIVSFTTGINLVKTVSPTSATGGSTVGYTITAMNTGSAPQSFLIEDVLGAGNNGGSLGYNSGSQSISFNPVASGTASGDITTTGINVQNLDAGATITITYNYTTSNSGIDFNQSSQFVNTASISSEGLSSNAELYILGPSSGGGGGGGGGGHRLTSQSINLLVQKEAKDQNGVWQDANDLDLAALVNKGEEIEIEYRIIVQNEGSVTGENIKIEDIFTSSDYERIEMKNIEGAEFDAETETFNIESIFARKEATITYTAVLSLLSTSGSNENKTANNTATIVDAENYSSIPPLLQTSNIIVKGIGNQDSALIETHMKGTGENIVLQKFSDKKFGKLGGEMTWNIVVQNRGDITYENLELTDNFPFAYMDPKSAKGMASMDKIAGTMTFKKDKLLPGENWVIRIKSKIKSNAPVNMKVRNTTTISASNSNLSELFAFAEIITYVEKPPYIAQTGFNALLLLLLTTLTAGAYTTIRRRRKRLQ